MKGSPWRTGILLGLVGSIVFAVWSCGVEHLDEENTRGESLSVYRFSIETGPGTSSLIFSQTVDGKKRFIETKTDDAVRFSGTIDSDSGRVVLDEESVLLLSVSDFWDGTPGDLTFLVEEGIEIARDFPAFRTVFPRFGAFAVTDGLDTVRGDFADVSPERGVDLSINGAGSTFLREAAFAGLYGVEADVRHQKASLAFMVVSLLVKQIFFVAETVDIIREHEQDLMDDESLTFSCEDFSLISDSGQRPERGSRALTFFDVDIDGKIGPGDGFAWNMVSCREGEQASLAQGFMDGRVNFTEFVEIREKKGSRDIIVRFGFDQENGNGVHYIDFVHADIRDSSGSSAFDTQRTFTINGGFDLVFSE